jgi:hypothetical protein
MIDDEDHDPLFAASGMDISRDRFHAFQRPGLEMGVPGNLVILETPLYRAVHTQYRQGRFQFGRIWAECGAVQDEGQVLGADAFYAR